MVVPTKVPLSEANTVMGFRVGEGGGGSRRGTEGNTPVSKPDIYNAEGTSKIVPDLCNDKGSSSVGVYVTVSTNPCNSVVRLTGPVGGTVRVPGRSWGRWYLREDGTFGILS